MNEHFTAWITTDASALDNDLCDVVVFADEVIALGFDEDGNEAPVWASNGPRLYAATTSITPSEDRAEDLIAEAEQLLAEAGWTIEGTWEAVKTGYTATVTR